MKRALQVVNRTYSSENSSSSSSSDSSVEDSMGSDLVRVYCCLLLFMRCTLVHLVFDLSQMILFIS